jgi:O-antigen/teichoic acid export membrane protein
MGMVKESTENDIQRLVGSGAAMVVASFIGNGLNYVFGIFLARYLGSQDFGLYALGITISNTICLIVLFGMDTGAVKFISEHLEKRGAVKAIRTISQIVSICMVCGVTAAIGLALASSYLGNSIYGKTGLDSALIFFAIGIPLSATTTVCLAALQAFQTVRYTVLIKYLWEPAGKFILAAAMLVLGFGIDGVLFAIVIVLAISTVLSLLALMRITHAGSDAFLNWNISDIRNLLVFTLPLSIATIVGVAAPRSDILVLGYWASSDQVGIYLAAFQTSAVLALVLGAFEAALAPIMSRAWANRDYARLKQAYQSASRLAFTITAPLWVVIIMFAENLMGLFGKDFVAGASILMILATAQVLNSMAGYANTVLLMSGHSRTVMMNTIVVGLIIVGMTSYLIPIWGLAGAAIAAAGGLIVMNMTRVVQVWRLHGIHPYTAALMRPCFASAAMACFLAISTSNVHQSYYPLFILGGPVVYLGVLLSLGFNEEDKIALSAFGRRFVPN